MTMGTAVLSECRRKASAASQNRQLPATSHLKTLQRGPSCMAPMIHLHSSNRILPKHICECTIRLRSFTILTYSRARPYLETVRLIE